MIPFNRTSTKLSKKELKEIKHIIEGGQVVRGKNISLLEKHFEEKFNVKHAIACSNCTSGLTIALNAIDTRDKTVALPAFTWYSTSYAVKCSGAEPVFCDINPDTFFIDENNIPDECETVIVVDTFGSEANVKTNRLKTIYDAAHGYGLSNLGQRGLIEVVSLSFTKVVTGMQGGVILTDCKSLAHRMREDVDKYAKLTEINALVALNNIAKYSTVLNERLRVVNMYENLIKVEHDIQYVQYDTNWSVYSILLRDKKTRDSVANNLTKNEIGYKIYYTPLDYKQNTADIYRRIIALPIYDGLSNSDVEFISKCINEVG